MMRSISTASLLIVGALLVTGCLGGNDTSDESTDSPDEAVENRRVVEVSIHPANRIKVDQDGAVSLDTSVLDGDPENVKGREGLPWPDHAEHDAYEVKQYGHWKLHVRKEPVLTFTSDQVAGGSWGDRGGMLRVDLKLDGELASKYIELRHKFPNREVYIYVDGVPVSCHFWFLRKPETKDSPYLVLLPEYENQGIVEFFPLD